MNKTINKFCIKCESHYVDITWCGEIETIPRTDGSVTRVVVGEEYKLELTCRQCGYSWLVPSLDSNEKDVE